MRSSSSWILAVSLALSADAPSATAQSLDFETYRERVEPIFLKLRKANGPGGACFLCHTHVSSAFRLQPVSADKPAWSEEQSRRNFEVVAKLVTPGDPSKSRLLLHPLAEEAGGDAIHAGGKQWLSRDDPDWRTLAAWVKNASAAPAAAAPTTATSALDFDVFKASVQPIFSRKRAGLARCFVCHSTGTNFRMQPLPPGSTSWSEEASRRNFEAVQRVVVPGDPLSSRLLMQPLASEAGGDPFHPGGKHWTSQDDPEWQTLAAWVRGRRAER